MNETDEYKLKKESISVYTGKVKTAGINRDSNKIKKIFNEIQ